MSSKISDLKKLPEDILEYHVYPSIPEGISEDDVNGFLENEREKIVGFLSGKIISHLWQHESFHLRPSKKQGKRKDIS